jgi:hypothetical protein
MPAADQGLSLDLDSLGAVLGPAGLHEFIDQAIVQPVLRREARLKETRQQAARARQDCVISPGGNFAIEETFDAFDFHDLVQDFGVEALADEELLRDVRRKNPYVVVRSKPRRTSIIVPEKPYQTQVVAAPKGPPVITPKLIVP